MLKTLFIEEQIDYLGTQLAPHWIYKNFNLQGDAVVGFAGEARVPAENMVDLSDSLDNAFIFSPLMLHFIVEHFDTNLELAVFRQRMFMIAIKEEMEQFEIPVNRRGDDLYVNKAKLSVSIATRSLTSTLIHVGINIDNSGTPVKTVGLNQLGIVDIKSFAENIMLRYKRELEQVYEARCKVRGLAFEG